MNFTNINSWEKTYFNQNCKDCHFMINFILKYEEIDEVYSFCY